MNKPPCFEHVDVKLSALKLHAIACQHVKAHDTHRTLSDFRSLGALVATTATLTLAQQFALANHLAQKQERNKTVLTRSELLRCAPHACPVDSANSDLKKKNYQQKRRRMWFSSGCFRNKISTQTMVSQAKGPSFASYDLRRDAKTA